QPLVLLGHDLRVGHYVVAEHREPPWIAPNPFVFRRGDRDHAVAGGQAALTHHPEGAVGRSVLVGPLASVVDLPRGGLVARDPFRPMIAHGPDSSPRNRPHARHGPPKADRAGAPRSRGLGPPRPDAPGSPTARRPPWSWRARRPALRRA